MYKIKIILLIFWLFCSCFVGGEGEDEGENIEILENFCSVNIILLKYKI